MKLSPLVVAVACAYSTFSLAAPHIAIGDYGFSTVRDIQSSMRMADVSPRFQLIDSLLGSLQGHNTSGLGLSEKKDPLNVGYSYSSQGDEAFGGNVEGVHAAVHTPSGFSAEGNYLHGLAGDGRYDAGRLRLAQDSRYGEFSLAGDITGADVGGKHVTRFQQELAGETHRAALGHMYHFDGLGSLANTIGWTHREETYDTARHHLNETQEYQTWNTTYSGQMGASQYSASITKGLSGRRSFSAVPLMGEFNPNFYALQLGYGIQGLALDDQLGYGLSGSYFNGSRDMPSAERMTIGGSGRGSSHEAGVVSGYRGEFAEARLYGMKVPGLSDLSIKPFISVNGGKTSLPIGGDYSLVSAEVGLVGRWADFSSSLSFAKSVTDDNLDHDSRLNFDASFTF